MSSYHYLNGANKKRPQKQKLFIALSTIGVVAGLYFLVAALAPMLPPTAFASGETVANKLTSQQPGSNGDRLYIPALNVDIAFAEGDASVLGQGAWWRSPENGNPSAGGNFALSAYRFQLGLSPGETRASSPFYNIGMLQVDDEIYVDYQGTRYVYKVVNKDRAPSSVAEIERHTDNPQLTLYPCDSKGEVDGQEVVHAQPIGTVAWSDTPQIVPLDQEEF